MSFKPKIRNISGGNDKYEPYVINNDVNCIPLYDFFKNLDTITFSKYVGEMNRENYREYSEDTGID